MKSNLKISNESNIGLIECRSFIELDRYLNRQKKVQNSILIQTLFWSSKQQIFDKLKLRNIVWFYANKLCKVNNLML